MSRTGKIDEAAPRANNEAPFEHTTAVGLVFDYKQALFLVGQQLQRLRAQMIESHASAGCVMRERDNSPMELKKLAIEAVCARFDADKALLLTICKEIEQQIPHTDSRR